MEAAEVSISDVDEKVHSWIPERDPSSINSENKWMLNICSCACGEHHSLFDHCNSYGELLCRNDSWTKHREGNGHFRIENGSQAYVCVSCSRRLLDCCASNPHVSPSLTPSSSVQSLSSISTISSATTTSPTFQQPGLCYFHSQLSLGGDVMDIDPEHKQLRKLKIRVESPKYREGSPSPYDFCNDSRSEEEDDEHCKGELSQSTMHDWQFKHDMVENPGLQSSTTTHQETPMSDVGTHDEFDKAEAPSHFFPRRSRTPSDCETSEDGGYDNSFYPAIYTDPSSSHEGEPPLDIENNTLLWVPPPPEEDDDTIGIIGVDDDDEDEESEDVWGLPHSLGSFKYRSKEKSMPEEQRKAMRAVVDGHFRVLVLHLLNSEGISVDEWGQDSWLEIVTSLSLQAASIIKPDTSIDGGMDPGGYLKVKCMATGRPSESQVIKGIVCKRNVAHKRMMARFKNPRLLILGGPIQFQMSFSSIETLIQKETDHLSMVVSRIEAHHPNVLLVEKNVSREAQDRLLAKGISLVLNVKRPLLDRIARCTDASIISSVEHLASINSAKVGYCEHFHVEKYYEEHEIADRTGKKLQKTLMFFEGCPKPLGCSILLKGSNREELKKVKRAVQFAVFAAYHLSLETSFLADEGVDLPELRLKSPLAVALPDKKSKSDMSISTVCGSMAPMSNSGNRSHSRPDSAGCMPVSMVGDAGVKEHSPGCSIPISGESSLKSSRSNSPLTSPFKVQETSNNAEYMKPNSSNTSLGIHELVDFDNSTRKDTPMNFESENACQIPIDKSNISVKNQLPDRFLDLRIIPEPRIQDDDTQGMSKEEFPPSPSNHQSILVSYSSSCLRRGSLCQRGSLHRIKYYGTFDKPLGRFLREAIFDTTQKCNSCGEPKYNHVECYTHRQGRLTIYIRQQRHILPGEDEGKIWMWHRCMKCARKNGIPPATRRLVMSDAAWGLSFGKFLELSFSNHAAASRVASCGHSLHRDCLRFYGFGNMVACLQYSPVNVYSVHLPPSKLEFCYADHQDWLYEEIKEISAKGDVLFDNILNRLQQLNDKFSCTDIKVQERKKYISELEHMLSRQRENFHTALQNAKLSDGNHHQHVDILQLNSIRQCLFNCSYLWEDRIQNMTSSIKSVKTPAVFESILNGDTILSFVKEISFGSGRNRKHDGHKEASDGHKLEFIGTSLMDALKGLDYSIGIGKSADQCTADQVSLSSQYSNGSASFSSSDACATDKLYASSNSSGSGSLKKKLEDADIESFQDVSAKFDAAWTGKGNTAKMPDRETPHSKSASVNEGNIKLDFGLLDEEFNAMESQIPSTLTSPAKAGDPSDVECWVGTPFSSFSRTFEENAIAGGKVFGMAGNHISSSPFILSVFEQSMANQGSSKIPHSLRFIEAGAVSIFEDEPTSIIAYAINSEEHQSYLLEKMEKPKDSRVYREKDRERTCVDTNGTLDSVSEDFSSTSESDDTFLQSKNMHVKVSFTDDTQQGKMKYTVICYYARQFESLRKRCCPKEDFIRSLCRCKKWGAQGGKSNVFFAKTADDRFVVKQVTKTELDSFITFASSYFKYISDALTTGSPTCLAKILGIYQVIVRHPKGGKEFRMDLMIMENLLYGRQVTRIYDLKGSLRSRYNADTSGKNAVLLDQNLLELIQTNPIFISNKAKRLLERAVWNDTSFLASVDVMDYSLLVGMDDEKRDLVLGIIDFMRQYTWDKHLETWVKGSGILGGRSDAGPTVISPKQYKKRFRKAMSSYFLMVPDQWSPPTVVSGLPHFESIEENLLITTKEGSFDDSDVTKLPSYPVLGDHKSSMLGHS